MASISSNKRKRAKKPSMRENIESNESPAKSSDGGGAEAIGGGMLRVRGSISCRMSLGVMSIAKLLNELMRLNYARGRQILRRTCCVAHESEIRRRALARCSLLRICLAMGESSVSKKRNDGGTERHFSA